MSASTLSSGRNVAPDDPSGGEPGPPVLLVTRPLVVITVVAVVVGVALRFFTQSSLWLDEALSVNIASLPLGDISEALRHDGHPPLYYVLLHGWIELFGSSDTAVRALSGLFAVITLPVAFLAGRRKGGPAVGLIVLAVLAMAPFALRYATETRMYSLVMLLVSLGYLLLDDVIVRGRSDLGRLAGLVAVTTALLYTHYWSMWLLAAVGLLLFWSARPRSPERVRRGARRALGAVVVGGVLFVPWVPNLLYQSAHTGTPWASAQRPLAAVATALGDFGGGGFRDAEAIGGLMLVLVLLAVFGRAVSGRQIDLDLHTVKQYRPEALVLVGTLAIGLAIGIVAKGAFASRYAAVIFPLFAILVAGGVSRFIGKWVQAGVLSGLLLLCGFGGVFNIVYDRSQNEALAVVVADRAEPGDLVVYCPDQLGPSGSRVMPDDVEQLSYPTLSAPQLVDWVDYTERNAAVDPAAVAQQVVDRADGQSIFVVWSGEYRTFEGQCEQFVSALGALRPGGEQLVASNSADNFEFAQLDYFPAAP